MEVKIMETVTRTECVLKHEAIKDKERVTEKRLNDHSERIGSVEDAIIKLTLMVESQTKKDLFDKILIISVFVISLVLAGVILGPEIIGKIMGTVK
jgi:hypothetical protein